MGDLSEFSIGVRVFLRAYPWRRIDPVPWTPLRKPLAASKLALVSSAGFIAPGQTPFDEKRQGGDPSFRQIDSNVDVRSLSEFHRSKTFDHRGIDEDPNLGFPIERARELVERGRLHSLNRRHLSFMGSITAPGRFVRETVPQAASWLTEDGVDVALLVPV
jgi:D-proline reductase (dithiol) PrdB